MKHQSPFFTIASIAMATLALSGCGSDSNSKDEPCGGACLEGQTCNEETNTCESATIPTKPECTSNDDCTDDKICKDQKCVPDEQPKPECTTDDDCTDGKICEDQKCIEKTDEPECNYNSECDPELICKDQKCVPECTTDDDCDGNQICKDSKCDTECTTDDDCDGNLLCQNERCVPECETDNDCSGALLCKDGQCAPECEIDLDCDSSEGQVCHEGECTEGCIDGAKCDNGYCDAGACVECTSDDHCADSANGTHCEANHCVECTSDDHCADSTNGTHCTANHCVACVTDDDCDGTMVCNTDKTCVPVCKADSDCASKDSAHPYCSNADQADAAACVECTADDQCAENYFCRENTCKVECESDIDCKDGKKCETTDNKCYECIENTDCGTNLVCDDHACVTCANNDADCDKILDDDELCPNNPNITVLKSDGTEVDCNYVTDADGTQVFEIWHPLDFVRLQEEIERVNQDAPAPEPCTTPVDPAAPVLGECCQADQYTQTCTSDKLLSCVDGVVTETACAYGCDSGACRLCTEHQADQPYVAGNCCFDDFAPVCTSNKAQKCVDGIVVEETCAYGCDSNACRLCTEHQADQPYVAGNCCFDDFAPVCTSNKAQKCVDGAVVEETCTYGCGENACNLCNIPADGITTLKVGDCCDAAAFAQECSSDQKLSRQCIDGIVQEVACEIPCATLSDTQVLCAALPQTKLKVRLMQDINIADALTDEDIKDVPFEALKVAWTEAVTDPNTNETTTVTHDPADSGYTPYAITDDTCVARWHKDARIQLKNIELDGQNHRIFFKTAEDKSCSLVDPFFGDIENAYIHDLSLNYNVRGLITNTFAKNIQNSTIDNISVVGNINLETKPALDEVNPNAYIQSNSLRAIAPYYYNIISRDNKNAQLNRIQYKGNITQNFTLTSNSVSDKMIPGVIGLFNTLTTSTVLGSTVTVPDFVYTYGRSFAPFVRNTNNNSAIYNPKVDIALISGRSDNTSIASSYISGFGYEIADTTIGGNIDIKLGNVSTPGNQYYGFAYKLTNPVILSDIHITAGDIQASQNYYGIADYNKNSDYKGIILKTGNIQAGSLCFGIGYAFENSLVQNNIEITTGDLKYKNYFGLFDNPNESTIKGATTITTGKHTSSDTYIGLAYTIKPVTFEGDVTIKTGDITAPIYYYGLGTEMSSAGITIMGKTNIETGDMTDMGPFYGLARNIKGTAKDITIKYKNIAQRYFSVSKYTSNFWGLAQNLSGKYDEQISDVSLEIGNITAPFYVCGLFETCEHAKVADNIQIKTGDITVGTNNYYKGDFDGLCKNMSGTLSNIRAHFGNIYIMGTYRAWALGTVVYSNGTFNHIRVEIDSLISESGRVGAVDSFTGTMENVGIQIHHLQTDAEQFSAINDINSSKKISNFAYYADIYAKTPVSSAFINNIKLADLNLENIFIAARINQYTTTDSTTHKASDGTVYHGHPVLFNTIADDAVSIVDDSDPANIRYNLNLATAKNVFWLKRHDDDFASEKTFMSIDGTSQFPGYRPNAVEYALQTGDSEIDPAATLSGCQYANTSCETPWADADHMKSITEPNGETITIPWLK